MAFTVSSEFDDVWRNVNCEWNKGQSSLLGPLSTIVIDIFFIEYVWQYQGQYILIAFPTLCMYFLINNVWQDRQQFVRARTGLPFLEAASGLRHALTKLTFGITAQHGRRHLYGHYGQRPYKFRDFRWTTNGEAASKYRFVRTSLWSVATPMVLKCILKVISTVFCLRYCDFFDTRSWSAASKKGTE